MLAGTPIVGGIPAMLPKMQPLLVRELIAETLLGPLKTILFFIYMLNIKIIQNIHFNNYLFLFCFVLFCFVLFCFVLFCFVFVLFCFVYKVK
jgi:hypothetical protein